jgi:cyanate permease
MQRLAGNAGLAGWQWLFILEAAPALVLAVIIFWFLDDRVKDAKWLPIQEREFIASEIEAEGRTKSHGSVREVFTSLKVWILCAILFGIVMGSYAVGFWQPTIIKGSGITDAFTIGLLTVVPYLAALISMILVGRHADRKRERRWHVVIPQCVAAAGFVICAYAGNNVLGLADFVSRWHRCRSGHRIDQLDRQSGGIRQPHAGWMAEDGHAFTGFKFVSDRGIATRIRLSYLDAASCKACQ